MREELTGASVEIGTSPSWYGYRHDVQTLMRSRPQRRTTMSKVTMMGTFTCRDGKAEEMEAVLAGMVDAASDEPGVEIYSYHRGEENTFWFFALMADEESMQNHGQSEAMQAAMSAFGPLVAGPPQMTVATPVAALGLDV